VPLRKKKEGGSLSSLSEGAAVTRSISDPESKYLHRKGSKTLRRIFRRKRGGRGSVIYLSSRRNRKKEMRISVLLADSRMKALRAKRESASTSAQL